MPNGYVHSTSTLMLAAVGGVVAYYNGIPLPQAAALTGGALAGLVLSPDLDVDRGSTSHKIMKKAGCLVGVVWRVFWWPYSRLIPHRHWLSHAPVISTALRILYLLWPLLLLKTVGLLAMPAWAPWAFAGLAAADGLHVMMDCLFKH